MVDDKDNNDDEYNFSDLDDLNSEMDDDSLYKQEDVPENLEMPPAENKRVYILIGVASLIGIFLLYKFLGSYFSSPAVPTKAQVQAPAPVVKAAVVETPAPVAPVIVSAPREETPIIKQKLDAMELTQQNLRSEVSTVKSQLEGLNASIAALTTKMADLSQSIATLSSTVEQQSVRITALAAPKIVHRKIRKVPMRFSLPPLVYNIQAVIPGRAWLIASNGSTLTVREGSEISGYGLVRLIDAVQGKVTMSSGRVIRFSQQDS